MIKKTATQFFIGLQVLVIIGACVTYALTSSIDSHLTSRFSGHLATSHQLEKMTDHHRALLPTIDGTINTIEAEKLGATVADNLSISQAVDIKNFQPKQNWYHISINDRAPPLTILA